MFLVYINDLPASLDQLTPVKFADDTNLILKGKNLSEMGQVLNSELTSLHDYFKANKLKTQSRRAWNLGCQQGPKLNYLEYQNNCYSCIY